MRKISVLIGGLLIAAAGLSQGPVNWQYAAKKIGNNSYEIHIKAAIEDGWHLYAQSQHKNFIGTPTSIRFTKHPLLVFNGEPREVGALEVKKQPILGTESHEYEDEVEFVQRVTVKANVKTNVRGSILFQVCTDEKCLQPTTVNFSVALN